MAECNEPGCSTSSLSDSLASGTRFTTVSSDGEDVEDSGEDASESSSRTSTEPESILSQLKAAGPKNIRSIMAYFWSIISIICEHQSIA